MFIHNSHDGRTQIYCPVSALGAETLKDCGPSKNPQGLPAKEKLGNLAKIKLGTLEYRFECH